MKTKFRIPFNNFGNGTIQIIIRNIKSEANFFIKGH